MIYIYIAYYTSKSGIWLVISRVASYFHEPEASANTAYEWNNITMSVISGLFYTSYSFNINITMKYTLDYTTRMPTREKITKPWNNFHGIWADISRYAYRW